MKNKKVIELETFFKSLCVTRYTLMITFGILNTNKAREHLYVGVPDSFRTGKYSGDRTWDLSHRKSSLKH